MIFGTCEHQITKDWLDSGDGEIRIKSTSKEGKRIISYEILCPMCREIALRNNLIIHNDEEGKKWLNG